MRNLAASNLGKKCSLRRNSNQVPIEAGFSDFEGNMFQNSALQELLWLGVDATGSLRTRARAPARTRSPSDRVWATRLLKIPQGSKTQFVSHSCFSITITSTKSLGPKLLMFYPQ